MNLGQITLGIYDRLGFNATPDSSVTRRINQYVNDAHREILSRRGFSSLRRVPAMVATSVANSPYMVLPQAAVAISVIVDRLNNRTLDPVSIQDLRYRDPGLNFSGTIPDQYAVIDYASCIAADPSVASALFVVSDAAADGPGLTANIEGTITGGYYQRTPVALNGTTAVNVTTAISSWVHVTKFYLSGSAMGNVTLHQTSGVGTELSRIPPGHSYPRYTLIHLSGTPATSQTYYCDVDLHIEDMKNATDEPLIPEDFHSLLETGAMKREYMRREKLAQWKIEDADWRQGVADLGAFLRRRGGISVNGQRGQHPRRISQYSSPWFNG
jgi:hypothetical protein